MRRRFLLLRAPGASAPVDHGFPAAFARWPAAALAAGLCFCLMAIANDTDPRTLIPFKSIQSVAAGISRSIEMGIGALDIPLFCVYIATTDKQL